MSIASSSSMMTKPDHYLSNGYTFKSFFISLIAFAFPIVQLFRCFLFTSFDSILLTPCCNLSAFSKYLSFYRSRAQNSVVWIMSMYGGWLLYVGTNFGPKFKSCILFSSSSFPVRFTTLSLIIFFVGVVLFTLLKVAFFKLLNLKVDVFSFLCNAFLSSYR